VLPVEVGQERNVTHCWMFETNAADPSDGGPDKMEICDILTRDRGLIHVKQRGASSTLSHLFAQGLSSAERLLTDGEFRRQAHDLVTAEDASYSEVLPAERPSDPSAYEVTLR
jgi:uncharacterized protein (TIGR04141 family)